MRSFTLAGTLCETGYSFTITLCFGLSPVCGEEVCAWEVPLPEVKALQKGQKYSTSHIRMQPPTHYREKVILEFVNTKATN